MPVGIGRLLHWHRHWNASGCLRRNRVVRSRDRQFLDIGRFACSEVRRPPIQAERTACKVAMGSYSCGGHFDGRRHLHVPCCDGLKAVLKLDLPSPGNQIPDLGDLAIKTAYCVLPTPLPCHPPSCSRSWTQQSGSQPWLGRNQRCSISRKKASSP